MNAGTRAEEREFRRFCSEGMLFEVQEWLRNGREIPGDGTDEESPLVLVARMGFHSLVKVLLEIRPSQGCLDAALAAAGAEGRLETCRLLLDHGASVGRARLADVVACGTPEVVGLLMAAGMDIEEGNALAWALVRESAGVLEFLRQYRRSKAVRRQGAMALKYLIINGKAQEVQRLRKAGADPRLEVPDISPLAKPSHYETTGLVEAVWKGSLGMVLAVGVRKTDDIAKLLDCAFITINAAVVFYLLDRGRLPVNDQPNGGSSLLQRCLRMLGHGGYFRCSLGEKEAEEAWKTAKRLMERGARWVPDQSDMRNVRFYMRFGSRERCVEAARLLLESGAASRETVAALFGTPMVRKWMGAEIAQITALLGTKCKPRASRREKSETGAETVRNGRPR